MFPDLPLVSQFVPGLGGELVRRVRLARPAWSAWNKALRAAVAKPDVRSALESSAGYHHRLAGRAEGHDCRRPQKWAGDQA
jgi:hypothetical protein